MEGLMGRLEEMDARVVALIDSAVALKEDLQIELAREFVKGHENQGNPQKDPVVGSDGAAQPEQAPLAPPKQTQTASVSKALSAVHLDANSREQQHVPMLEAVLKNQEALQTVLMNQDLLKNLVERLQKTVSNIDERLHAIEQEMGLLARFTQELNAVENEVSWG